MSDRVIDFHLDEIDAWRSGQRASPGNPATGERYAGRMLDAIKRHEQALIKLGHKPTIDYVSKHGFADGQRGSSGRHHATKKSPAQLQREIDAFLQSRRGAPNMPHAIPDRGYMVAQHGGGTYLSSFGSKDEAVRFARGLAKQTREHYDIVKVQNRGEDRFVVDEIAPLTGRTTRSHSTKKQGRAIRADQLGHPDRIMLDGKRFTVYSTRPTRLRDGTVKFTVNSEQSTVAHHVVLPADEMVEVGWV